ncbi:MAG: C69 family dipeptidase [Clostridia bacterium]|nr:C69 family dipeptidase [Clostridia bacterium]
MNAYIPAMANCMTVVVGASASKTGRVLLAHNEDDYVHAKVKHHFVPARDWAEGTLLPAEEGLTRIPQVSHTHALYWVELIGEDGGLSTSDCFLNEKGVCVVSDSSCGSREHALDPELCKDGITYELRRAVAERADSAKHALDIACELVEKYGYASDGRIYFFADRHEAFMLQLCRGRTYAACRIPDDAIAVMPNHYTIHSLRDCIRYPKDIIDRAIQKGWYKPQKADLSDFDFAEAYQDPRTLRHPENTLRQKYTLQLLLGREWDMEKEGFPPYVRAAGPISLEELIDAMSTHYEGSFEDVRFGTGQTPHETSVRRVCTATTVESMIVEFTENPAFNTVWTAFGRPCELMHIPLHPLCGIPEKLEKQEDPFEAAEKHFVKKPRATAYHPCHWQEMQLFQNLLEFRYAERINDVKRMNETAHARFLKKEEKLRSGAIKDVRKADKKALDHAIGLMNGLMRGDDSLDDADIDGVTLVRRDGATLACVEFDLDGEPEENSISFGPGRTQLSRSFAKPVYGSLRKTEKGRWKIDMLFEQTPLKSDGAGVYEFILGGKRTDGRCFSGMTLVQMNEDGSGKTTLEPDS